MQCTPDGLCTINYDAMSVRQLKQLLSKNRIDYSICVEKTDLVQLAQQNNLSVNDPVICVDVISDTMCPWCFVGKRNMEQAVSQFKQKSPATSFKITWLPFFLNPHIPNEGVTLQNYLSNVYGDTKRLEGMHKRLEAVGKQVGINFLLDENRKIYPTIHSHRLVEWAKGFDKQNEAMEELFKSHFEQGKSLNDIEMLSDVAEKIGLDRSDAKRYLLSDEKVSDIQKQDAMFKQGHRGVNGVPHFIIYSGDKDSAKSLSGAQPPEEFARIFQQLI